MIQDKKIIKNIIKPAVAVDIIIIGITINTKVINTVKNIMIQYHQHNHLQIQQFHKDLDLDLMIEGGIDIITIIILKKRKNHLQKVITNLQV